MGDLSCLQDREIHWRPASWSDRPSSSLISERFIEYRRQPEARLTHRRAFDALLHECRAVRFRSYDEFLFSIGILESIAVPMKIGMSKTCDRVKREAVWFLRVREIDVTERWLIINGPFIPVV